MSSASKQKRFKTRTQILNEYQDTFDAPMKSRRSTNDKGQLKKVAKLYPRQFK